MVDGKILSKKEEGRSIRHPRVSKNAETLPSKFLASDSRTVLRGCQTLMRGLPTIALLIDGIVAPQVNWIYRANSDDVMGIIPRDRVPANHSSQIRVCMCEFLADRTKVIRFAFELRACLIAGTDFETIENLHGKTSVRRSPGSDSERSRRIVSDAQLADV